MDDLIPSTEHSPRTLRFLRELRGNEHSAMELHMRRARIERSIAVKSAMDWLVAGAARTVGKFLSRAGCNLPSWWKT